LQRIGNTEHLYGIHAVREALMAGRRRIHQIYISEKRTSQRILKLIAFAESKRIPVRYVSSETIRSTLKADKHQGIGAEVSLCPFVDLNRLLATFKEDADAPLLLILDHIVDPQNMGGLIRTASCVGVNGVIIPKDRSASPTPTVSKASAGALEHISITPVTNLVRTIRTLKEKGIWIMGLDKAADNPIFFSDVSGPIALVVGGEEKGIRSLVRQNCDMLVSIPQTGRIDSLNASVAGAVAMYEIYRQRQLTKASGTDR
jgi:23S rRNA (guanosine2251-2'-O)-methyltransferase